jgi:hypothetical protein
MDWIHHAQDCDQWQVFVKTAMNLQATLKWVIFLHNEPLLAISGTCSVELVT